MSLVNVAKSGFFSSDRSIQEYADRIWALTPVKVGKVKAAKTATKTAAPKAETKAAATKTSGTKTTAKKKK